MSDDSQFLRQFAANRSEAAFGELVARHVTLVYSAALRQTNGDAHLAKDVAQLVFADLARKAPALSEKILLAGWLHRATIFAARQILRTERRRQIREQEAVHMNSLSTDSAESENADWRQIRPLLDDALNRLSQTDRDALLLRFFENQTLAQVGARLGGSEDAARKRVHRALEKLRAILTKRSVTTTAAALSAAISANAIQTATATLAATLTTASLTTARTGTFTLLKIMTATKLKLAFSSIVVAGAATALVVQHQNQTKLRGENESLQQQIAQLQTDNASLSNRIVDIGEANKLPEKQFSELLKLRGEVGVLRRQLEEAKNSPKIVSVQSHPELTPEQQKQRERIQQENQKINQGRIWCAAIQQFALQTRGLYPTNFDQLQPFVPQYDTLVESNRFEIVNEGDMSNLPYPEIIIVLREKEASKIANGRLWQRYYGFADGNIKPVTSTDGNFDEFERKHMISPATGSQ